MKIILTVASVTYAIKGKKLLQRGGIIAQNVKLSDNGSCVHGIEISESDMFSAADILRSNGVNYKVHQGRRK